MLGRKIMSQFQQVDLTLFVKDWEAAKGVKEVAEKHKLTQAEASRLAAFIRRKGVLLKKFRSRLEIEVDVKALGKFIGGNK